MRVHYSNLSEGAAGRTRTDDLELSRLQLYPSKLPPRLTSKYSVPSELGY